MVKRICTLIALVLFLVCGCEPQAAATVTDISGPDENGYYICEYNGIQRKYCLYIPEAQSGNIPLVFMLHGYADSAKGFMASTGMNETAGRYGYAVVYPQGLTEKTHIAGGACWNSGLTNAANDDAGFLKALAKHLQQKYGFRKDAAFAAGFSNGAFMMYKLACEAPDTFRAVASVSGAMSGGAWDERPVSASVSILQINGTADTVVPLGTGESDYGNAPAIGGVIEYWRNANGLDEFEQASLSDKAKVYRYSSKKNCALVWYVEIEGGGHSWPQIQTAGFDANELILDFFSRCAA